MNAKKELLQEIDRRPVLWVQMYYTPNWDGKVTTIEGTLEEVLLQSDFEYNSGYGSQEITGTIWYNDSTWSERREYDGSEWWEYKERPPMPELFGKRFEVY